MLHPVNPRLFAEQIVYITTTPRTLGCSSMPRPCRSPSSSRPGSSRCASIDPDGYLAIVDRSKDLIKSGGEWIRAIALENAACGHPQVMQAAVIAAFHPKWQERLLLIVTRRPGSALDREALLEFLRPRVPRWWLPDDVVFVPEMPLTATGKIHKLTLRERFRDHALPAADRPPADGPGNTR